MHVCVMHNFDDDFISVISSFDNILLLKEEIMSAYVK